MRTVVYYRRAGVKGTLLYPYDLPTSVEAAFAQLCDDQEADKTQDLEVPNFTIIKAVLQEGV